MSPIYKQVIRSSVLGPLALGAMLFIPAGTLNYWQGWAYFGTSIFASALYTIYLVKYDPALLQRRQQAGPSHEKEPAQKIIVLFIFAAFVMLIALPPLDYRCWSPAPCTFRSPATRSSPFFYLVSKVNAYAAANVRVEKGNASLTPVCTVSCATDVFRHIFLSSARRSLGSWWTLFLTPVFLLLLFPDRQRGKSAHARSCGLCGISTESQISPHPVRLVNLAD
jgi:protein-S-isoprenylcysteine O-methyltransferase Ste14